MKKKRNLRFAWSFIGKSKKHIFITLITNAINVACNIVLPILSAKMIMALTSNDFARILMVAGVLLIVDALDSVVVMFSRKASGELYRNTVNNIELELGREVLKLENEVLDEKGTGVFIQRMTNDTSRLADVFNAFIGLGSEVLRYVGIFIAIFVINKIVFLYVVIMVTILYLIERGRTNLRNKNDKILRKGTDRVSSFIGELVRGSRDIKMLNSENDFIKELDHRIKDINGKRYRFNKLNINYRFCSDIVSTLFKVLLIVLLVFLMKDHFIESAIALVLYNYADQVRFVIYTVGTLLEYTKDFNLSADRIFEIMHSDEYKKEKFGTTHLAKVNGDFEFKNVTFGYKKENIFKDLNFKINANETVAFVGKSGAGKTTIFNLLCKMYDVKSGEILIDGININELDKDTIRGNITVISQNPYIFNMSIKDNLKLVKSNLTDKEMKEACKVACLHDYIMSLPKGYNTLIGEGGINLSGGQKQRLAIARALVQKTEIILFDEATSALDNETQDKIQKAIENMKSEYTILIIAHRLSTIINSDRILFLEDGKIIAEGTHKELLEKCPEYKKLYETESTI